MGTRADGRQPQGPYTPYEWNDVALKAPFLVELGRKAYRGFRRAAGSNYYYVHYDRPGDLCRRSNNGWNEIKRSAILTNPRHGTGEVQCQGDTLRVFLNGSLLYEAQDPTLAGGRVGFYAGEGVAHVKDIVIAGEARPAADPLAFPPPTFVHVCTDAGAGAYEAFPDVCRLQDGRLICVFSGHGHVAMPNNNCRRAAASLIACRATKGADARPDAVRRSR